MTESKITEAGSVQFPMVRHAAEIGWAPLPPSNALAMRGGEAGLLFRGVLEEALRRFNSWMTDDAVRSVRTFNCSSPRSSRRMAGLRCLL